MCFTSNMEETKYWTMSGLSEKSSFSATCMWIYCYQLVSPVSSFTWVMVVIHFSHILFSLVDYNLLPIDIQHPFLISRALFHHSLYFQLFFFSLLGLSDLPCGSLPLKVLVSISSLNFVGNSSRVSQSSYRLFVTWKILKYLPR